jgi:hypothetical protein
MLPTCFSKRCCCDNLCVKYTGSPALQIHSSGDKQPVLYGLVYIARNSLAAGPINHDECILSAGLSLHVDQIYLTITVLITRKGLRNQS